MRKPIPGNVVVARWMVALIVLIAVAVGVSEKVGSTQNAAGADPSGGRNFEMAATVPAPFSSSASSQAATPAARARVRADFAALPLAFEANQGQTDARVKYMARGQGYQLFLTANEAVFALHSAASGRDTSAKSSPLASRAGRTSHPTTTDLSQAGAQASGAIRMQFVGANADAEVAAANPMPGVINYYFGNDPAKWQQSVKQYSSVTYRQVYPGVDVAYHGQQRQLEFDFIVAPGANPAPITANFAGASKIATDGAGNLLLSSTAGDVLLHRPVAYQEKNGSRELVESRFVLEAKNRVRFELGNYDRSRELVIDPSVSYATYLGGSGEDDGYAIAVDSTGAVYVTGQTASTDFPTASPEQGSNAGGFDVFVTKFAPGGGSLDFSTYIGGSGNDSGNAIAVNSNGVYVAGGTSSGSTGTTAFPTTHNALQTSYGGGSLDGFVLELSSSAGTLVYSTYLGGTGTDFAEGIALDTTSGNTYIVGSTGSSNFPIAPQPGALQSALNGASNGFVTELNSSGTAVLYSTFLGGGNGDFASAVALDPSGNAYVTGITYSSNFPTTQGAYQTTCGTGSSCNGGLSDAFVSVIQPGGTAFAYSTFLGGSDQDQGLAIAVDSSQDAYVTGLTLSSDFPIQSPLQPMFGGGTQDAFVTVLNPNGSALLYSTYLGGSGNDAGSGISVDANENVYVTGQTSSSNFPVANATQGTNGGGNDAFVTEINSNGSSFVFSTYLGGSQNEDSTTNGSNLSPVGGITVNNAGTNIYVTGNTFSSNFPTASAEQGTIGGGNSTTNADAFLASYTQTATSSPSFIIGNGALLPASGGPGVSATATITVTSRGGFNASVALACSVSPSVTNGPTCTITSPVTPAAGGSATATLNVATTSGTLALDRPSVFDRSNDRHFGDHHFGGALYALFLPVGLALLGTGIGSKSSRRKKLFGFLMLGLLAAGILLMPACSSSGSGGGGGGGGGTPQNTYTITVTGTSGSSVVTGSPAPTLTVN